MSSSIGSPAATPPVWQAQVSTAREHNDTSPLIYLLIESILPSLKASTLTKESSLSLLATCAEDIRSFGPSSNKLKALSLLHFAQDHLGSELTLHKETTKYLPFDNKEQIDHSLAIFRNWARSGSSDAFPALANWLDQNQIPLMRLNLTAEELSLVAPHLTYLYLSDTDLSSFNLTSFTRLESLTLIRNSLSELPALPDHLKHLHCHEAGIREIRALPASLRDLDCSACYSLQAITSPFPDTLRKLTLDSCSALTSLPPLNSALEEFSCSGCEFEILPPLPPHLKKLDCSDCKNLKSLPPLSASVIINARDCPLLKGELKK